LVALLNNGYLRMWVQSIRGEPVARVVTSLTGVAIVFVIARVFLWAAPEATPRELLAVGTTWLVLTAAADSLFEHLVAHVSWTELAGDYNVLHGRLWVLVLLGMVVAPSFWSRHLRRVE
jgi:hypothetical protein